MKLRDWGLVLLAVVGAMALIGLVAPQPPVMAQHTPAQIPDPCFSQFTYKQSAAINLSAAGTTQPVAPSAGKVVYVCSATFTIAPSGTSADTLQFTTGTGGTCGTNTATMTGTFGDGDLTTTTGVVPISLGSDGTEFAGASGAGLCLVAAGTTVKIQGVLNYVQQ